MQCPKCWHDNSVAVDYTPEFNSDKPYEAVCYNCGWFSKRYKTKAEASANQAINSDAKSHAGY